MIADRRVWIALLYHAGEIDMDRAIDLLDLQPPHAIDPRVRAREIVLHEALNAARTALGLKRRHLSSV